ncbi:hypothetical protein [Emergencia sp.]|uniref:hypothetical protein n=1 Tax=Emergencia sp. TaxID=1926557 RepID=UPI003AF1358F
MELMGTIFVLLGIVAFVMYYDLAKKVKKLERMIKDSGIVDIDEEWLLIRSVKKEQEGLVRVDFVKGVQFV